MAGVPASSHGTAFNGGTITQPLVIAPTDPATIPLSIEASWNAWSTDFLRVLNTDTSTRMFAVDGNGNTLAFRHTSEADNNIKSTGSSVQGELPGVVGAGATGSRSLGFYDHAPVAQQSVTSGTVTPEQIALALQANGALGGT